VVVTNQAGVARGLYGEAAVAAVHRRLRRLLAGAGVRLDAVLYCPHHPEGTVGPYARACRDRKPGPGLLETAARRLGLDLAGSFLIGNSPTDVGAAVAAGVTPLFVTTGHATGRPPPPGVAAFGDLAAAVDAVPAGETPLFVTTGQAAGRPPPPGVAAFDGLAAAVDAVLAGGTPAGREEARPAPAVTGRAWPGMPVGRERARP